MMRRVILIAVAVFAQGSSSVVRAQITVQQPVVRSTSIGTTVSVPDRGSTFLGGVSSAESSRQQYGPWRTGSSRGYSRSAASMSASVRIIDLREMDEALLNSVPDSTPTPWSSPTPWHSASSQWLARDQAAKSVREPMTVAAAVPAEKAAKFERLAQQAESAGHAGVAKLHWQMAAKHGSTLAHERLDRAPK